jgi:hypothetical protein
VTDIFDISKIRQQRQAEADGVPDPDCVRHDEYGRPLYCYIIEYHHQGATYSLDLWCYSEAEAIDHMLSIAAGASYVGQKLGIIPA